MLNRPTQLFFGIFFLAFPFSSAWGQCGGAALPCPDYLPRGTDLDSAVLPTNTTINVTSTMDTNVTVAGQAVVNAAAQLTACSGSFGGPINSSCPQTTMNEEPENLVSAGDGSGDTFSVQPSDSTTNVNVDIVFDNSTTDTTHVCNGCAASVTDNYSNGIITNAKVTIYLQRTTCKDSKGQSTLCVDPNLPGYAAFIQVMVEHELLHLLGIGDADENPKLTNIPSVMNAWCGVNDSCGATGQLNSGVPSLSPCDTQEVVRQQNILKALPPCTGLF